MVVIKYICITLAVLFSASMIVSLANGARPLDALVGGLTVILLFGFLAYRADKAIKNNQAPNNPKKSV